jgi:DNA-binding winged helix-turn-helix (wHTH) protein
LRKALMQHGEGDPVRTVRGAGYAFGADSRSVQSVASFKAEA